MWLTKAFDEAFDYLRQRSVPGTYMGGSTGALRYDLPFGSYVGKRGAHPEHVRNEYDMLQYLQSLGVRVPDSRLMEMEDRPLMLTEFIQGGPLMQRDRAAIQRDIAPHALIGNWDVTGLDEDNVIMDAGRPVYVDLGGAGPYRAQGRSKRDMWNPDLMEFDTLRQRNPYFRGMTEEQMAQSMYDYGGPDAFRAALPAISNEDVRDMMARRIDTMERRFN
jgi:hypothetical protein